MKLLILVLFLFTSTPDKYGYLIFIEGDDKKIEYHTTTIPDLTNFGFNVKHLIGDGNKFEISNDKVKLGIYKCKIKIKRNGNVVYKPLDKDKRETIFIQKVRKKEK
jgi:hypothetical protein